MKEKKNGAYVSVYLRNNAKFVCDSSGVLSLVSGDKVDCAKPFTKAGKTPVSTERVVHFFDEIRLLLLFPLNEKHFLF